MIFFLVSSGFYISEGAAGLGYVVVAGTLALAAYAHNTEYTLDAAYSVCPWVRAKAFYDYAFLAQVLTLFLFKFAPHTGSSEVAYPR